MIPLDLPGAYLVLDLGNRCPLACRHCIQSEAGDHAHFQQRGQMAPALAAGLLDELAARGRRFHSLILFWLGEPLTHPEFVAILERAAAAAKEGVFHRIEVHTNAVLLDPEIARRICAIRGVNQRWHFSLDAASEATYARVKGGDHYREARRNVLAFLEERAAAGNEELAAVFQFIPQADNEAEAPAFVRSWCRAVERLGGRASVVGRALPEDAGDAVFFRQLDALDPALQGAADRLYRRVLRQVGIDPRSKMTERLVRGARALRSAAGDALRSASASGGEDTPVAPCACPFLSPVVHWDGRVTVCTRDSGLTLSPGSLADASFHDLWWEAAGLGALREAHLRGDAGGLCRGCPIPRSANYTGLAADELERYHAARDMQARR